MSLRVLHLGKYYPPARGGIETVVAVLCRGERASADSQALVINRQGPTTSEVIDGVPCPLFLRSVGQRRPRWRNVSPVLGCGRQVRADSEQRCKQQKKETNDLH